MRRFLVAAGATVALVVSLTAGCSSGAETSSKAGGDAAPITLRIGTDDGPGRPAADQISEFARQAEQLSDGAIIIEPVWQADGPQHNNWDQLVARMVVSGELDMGMIPARAWDTEGVTSLRALHAPFLIDSEELMAAAVTADIAADMLAGLDPIGITGLALVPESMRQVFSFGEPLLTPEQFRGVTIRAPRSDTTYALFKALGATVNDAQGDEFADGVSSGTVAGAEASFVLAGSLPSPAVGTGNLPLFPKINSLVVNSATFDALNEQQRAILQQAADATREWAIGEVIDVPAAAMDYCKNSGSVVVTSADNVAAFERAAAPVYEELESDPSTKEFIQQLRDLKTNSPAPATVIPCAPPAVASSPTPAGATQAEFPEGVYRTEMSGAAGLAAGLAPDTANAMDGINTLTFQDGQFLHDIKRDQPDQCHGTYAVESGRLVVTLTDCGAPPGGRLLFSAAWTFDGTTLIFTDVRADFDPNPEALWGSREWTKIDASAAVVEPEFPAGVYRTQLTSEELSAGGLDESTANGLAGIQTLSFDNGTWIHYGVARGPGECTGTYTVTGGRLIVTITPRCGGSLGVLFNAAWTVDGSGVTFTDVRSDTDSKAFAAAVWGHQWERIG